MTEINNRIEEVKKILIYADSNISWKANETHEEHWEGTARQICQLFPQPLDDKELREKIYQALIDNTGKRREHYGDVEVTHTDTNIDGSVKSILALLQQKIEELRQESEARQEIIRRLITKCEQLLKPLDDKGFREKIKDAGHKCPECLGTGTFYKEYHGSQCYKCEGRGVIVDDDQILALLPQRQEPLDDKKFREEIAKQFWVLNYPLDSLNATKEVRNVESWWKAVSKETQERYFIKADQLLPLLQLKIEEARRQIFDEIEKHFAGTWWQGNYEYYRLLMSPKDWQALKGEE